MQLFLWILASGLALLGASRLRFATDDATDGARRLTPMGKIAIPIIVVMLLAALALTIKDDRKNDARERADSEAIFDLTATLTDVYDHQHLLTKRFAGLPGNGDTANGNWSTSDHSALASWATLLLLKELTVGFASSPDSTMSDLKTLRGAGGTNVEREIDLLCARIDYMLIKYHRFAYGDGVDSTLAVDRLCRVVNDETKTVRDLAAAVSLNYVAPRDRGDVVE